MLSMTDFHPSLALQVHQAHHHHQAAVQAHHHHHQAVQAGSFIIF